MARAKFYTVKPEAYLFPLFSQKAGDQQQNEEPIRQWCTYELMRAYGISITDIKFESTVRVGSKTYRIDILVLRNGFPFIIVECKAPSHKKHKEALAQAISYADSQTIHAEFVIYTNGDVWQVKRKVSKQWVNIPDLPHPVNGFEQTPFSQLLLTIRNVAPLLHKMDETLAAEDNLRFLDAMQIFFHGENLLTQDVNFNLRVAADNILRVLAGDHPQYQFQKLHVVQTYLETYRKEAGYNLEILKANTDSALIMGFREMNGVLLHMAGNTNRLLVADAMVLRIIVALSEYGAGMMTNLKKIHFPIPPNVRFALREFIEHSLAVNLNVSLPDPVDTGSINDMKHYCGFAWSENNPPQ